MTRVFLPTSLSALLPLEKGKRQGPHPGLKPDKIIIDD